MLRAELDVALRLAEAACAAIMKVYEAADGFEVITKSDGSPVTAADEAADALIVAGLRAAFPDDAILSEEAEFTDDPTGKRLWMVDPLDGTRDFAHRTGDFAVMIGLCVDARPVLGVVAAPALGRTWAGAEGLGAFEVSPDGSRRPLRVVEPAEPVRVLASRNHPPPDLAKVLDTIGPHQLGQRGSVGVKIGLIAAGDADVYLHPAPGTSLWDCAAPEAIMRAAGGTFSVPSGDAVAYAEPHTPKNPRGILAGHPATYARVRDLLNGMR